MSHPLMYSEIAPWWPLLSAPSDYAEEASFYIRTLLEAAAERPRTLLELGSGGGNNASYMKKEFSLTLVDLSPDMLAVSRELNPECEHIEGDMRAVRLGRTFDAVFVHDAIAYMTTLEDLETAVRTAYAHTRPGGVALFCPDYTRETFMPGTDHGGRDHGDRGMRYLEWVWDPDPSDSVYIADYVYALRDKSGDLTVLHDRHEEGLFSRDEWSGVLSAVGFEPHLVPFRHSEVDHDLLVFVGKRSP